MQIGTICLSRNILHNVLTVFIGLENNSLDIVEE
jgi:hypothetical protein